MIKLRTWLIQTFGKDAPTMWTARKWAREKKISPEPKKVGREWHVENDAEYTNEPLSLVEKLRGKKSHREPRLAA